MAAVRLYMDLVYCEYIVTKQSRKGRKTPALQGNNQIETKVTQTFNKQKWIRLHLWFLLLLTHHPIHMTNLCTVKQQWKSVGEGFKPVKEELSTVEG